VLCDEHGIGGRSTAQLGRINVLYHEASGDKYVPRTVLLDLELGVIGDVRASPLG
jgi:tubulin beta